MTKIPLDGQPFPCPPMDSKRLVPGFHGVRIVKVFSCSGETMQNPPSVPLQNPIFFPRGLPDFNPSARKGLFVSENRRCLPISSPVSLNGNHTRFAHLSHYFVVYSRKFVKFLLFLKLFRRSHRASVFLPPPGVFFACIRQFFHNLHRHLSQNTQNFRFSSANLHTFFVVFFIFLLLYTISLFCIIFSVKNC